MTDKIQLADPGSERAILGTILKYGKDALIDSSEVLDSTDFSLPINRVIYTTFKTLADESSSETFDLESLQLKAKNLGFGDHFKDKKSLEYLEYLKSTSFAKENIKQFGLQIKKFSIVRDLYDRYRQGTKYLEGITGNETLSDIIKNTEEIVVDYTNGLDTTNQLSLLTEKTGEYVQQMMNLPEVQQTGIPTGFNLYDNAIGGGVRRSTINLIGARLKIGKSALAINMAINIAKNGTKVLYIDTEMTLQYQRDRAICVVSGCPISLFETRQFKHSKEVVEAVMDASKAMEQMPLYYQSVAGLSHPEILSIIKRWLVKNVKPNEDCVVIFDYLKVMDGAEISNATPEWLRIGFIMNDLHNFAVKHRVPIILFSQLNRIGIEVENSSSFAASDRQGWIASSLTILKQLDENDSALGISIPKHGTRKLIILDCRYGAGLEQPGDYILVHASLRPISSSIACGSMREGLLASSIIGNRTIVNDNGKKN